MDMKIWILEGGRARVSTSYLTSFNQTEPAVAMICLNMTINRVYKVGLVPLVSLRPAPPYCSL